MNAFNTKVSKSKQGSPRFPKHDNPVNNEVKTYTLSPEELEYYRQKGKIEMGGKTMKAEQAQELEKTVSKDDLVQAIDEVIELRELEKELAEVSKNNVTLQNLLDDLQDKYNQLALDYETAEQVKYDLTRTEGQRDQLKASLKETEDELVKESKKRWILEEALKMYLP